MKKLITCASWALLMLGCSDAGKTSEENVVADTSSSTEPMTSTVKYAYTLPEPYAEWERGDMKHVETALNSLKAWETGDIAACVTAFGDSVLLRFDGFHQKLSQDSLLKHFTKTRAELASQEVQMHDWESVISKDRSKEYVTLWYKEISTDKKGRKDSVSVVDDLKFVNGKIVELDQKIQHFPAKK